MSNDPFEGLDADERAEAEAVGGATASGSGGAHPSARRAVWILGFFVIAYVPIVLGATWLVNSVVYEPLCRRDGEVVSIQQGDADVANGGQPAECRFADGREVPVADIIGSAQDWVLTLVVMAFRFGLPFVVVYLVVRLFTRRRPEAQPAWRRAGPGIP
ncbi:MAG: hypothetical protein AAGG08_16755 [Actinomycetota bacterium]